MGELEGVYTREDDTSHPRLPVLPGFHQARHLVMALLVAGEMSATYKSCTLAWLSHVDSSLVYNARILASSSLVLVWCLANTFDRTSPLRALGTWMFTSPLDVRNFPLVHPGSLYLLGPFIYIDNLHSQ